MTDGTAKPPTLSVDGPLFEYTDDTLARPLAPGLSTARADVVAAARDILAIPEAALTKPWAWRRDSEEEVRYGAYRAAEALESAELDARRLMARNEATERRAARLIGPTTAARWDLHGILLPLDDAMLDADPGGGEWTIRLTMGHVIAGQRGYGWGSAWWVAQGLPADDPSLPPRIPEAVWATLPDEATTEAAGSIDDLRARLDAVTDITSGRLAGIPDASTDLGARWAGFPVTVGFRFGRWSSHIREHAIQIEKTFEMLGHAPFEPARLVRNLLAAYGRAESTVFARADADDAAARIASGAAEARDTTSTARRVAGA